MALLFKADIERGRVWLDAFEKHAPDLDIRVYPDTGEPEDIEYALVWEPPEGLLSNLPNLKAIFSVGAGVDHLAKVADIPEGVPVARMVEPGLTAGMTEFVVMSVLMHHRFMIDYLHQQREHHWHEINQVPAEDRGVGILGLGHLGQDAAEKLKAFGFKLAGWSRSPKDVDGVECFHGDDQLSAFLAQSDILVCLLPLTPETEGILDADLLSQLPKGASLVSVGRGQHMVEEDVLEALNSDQLSGAVLDVFAEEPLPEDSAFWDHPRVILTPHVASMTIPDTAVKALLENIERIERGEEPLHQVDLKRGY